jgi:dihydroflavonol-4-reductase
MKILITGADGMLGSNLVRLLLERGHEVIAFVHPASCSTSLEGLPITRKEGDILIPETIQRAIAGCDAVIHAAASTSVWPARSKTVWQINVEGTRNIIEAVLKEKISRMIYIGSGSSVNTSTPPTGKYNYPGAKFGLDYNDSKYEALNMVLEAVATRELPALAILPTFMIGPWDTLPGSGKMVLASAQGKMKFYTNGGRNFIHVKDVAGAVANSLESGSIGNCYIAGNENLTYREFFNITASVVHQPPPRICVPGWMIKLIGLLGDAYGVIFRRPPLLTYPMARISCENQFVSGEKAVRELNMPQTGIETAIRECYEWFLENGYINK